MAWRRALPITLLVAVYVLLAGAAVFQFAMAQGASEPDSIAAELIGAAVYAGDGTHVGEVSAVSEGADGQISEVRITTASPLGLGQRTVVLPPGSVIVLRGAVVVDLSPAEVDALPSVSQLRGPQSHAALNAQAVL